MVHVSVPDVSGLVEGMPRCWNRLPHSIIRLLSRCSRLFVEREGGGGAISKSLGSISAVIFPGPPKHPHYSHCSTAGNLCRLGSRCMSCVGNCALNMLSVS